MIAPVEPKDLWPLPVYARIRDEVRRQVIAHKKPRRLALGPDMSVLFETRLTVKFQVMELVRAEGITSDAAMREELEAFNPMLPGEGALHATLMVEADAERSGPLLETLAGLAGTVHLDVGGARVTARFDAARDDGRRISAVQFLHFTLGEHAARLAPDAGGEVRLVCEHPRYRHAVTLSPETRRALADDLES